MNKLEEFINYLMEQVDNHSIYVWGGQGQRGITESWIRNMETSAENASRAIAFWKKQVAAGFGGVLAAYDCSGLGCDYLMDNDLIVHDMTAEGLRRLCDKVTIPQKGDFVFRVSNNNAYHVGYVVSDDLLVVEAKGRDYGVCITRDLQTKNGYWNEYRRPAKIFGGQAIAEISPQKPAVTAPKLSRVLKNIGKPYMRGADVQQAQKLLIAADCSCGSSGADGVFGGGTEKAVIKYQTLKKLTIDGEIGPQTWGSLGGAWVKK